MWKSLRAAVEDGVKDFSREAITEFNTTLSDVSSPQIQDTCPQLLRTNGSILQPGMWHVYVRKVIC